MDTVQVGRVTLRKGAKLHYIQDGRAVCPVVQGRHAIGEGAKPVEPKNVELVCKRCRPTLLAAAKDASMEANQRAGHSTVRNGMAVARAAEALVLALETPAGRLARQRRTDEMRAQFDAIVAASLTDLAPAA